MSTQPPVITISSSASDTSTKIPTSSHRLPTVSASQALRDLQAETPRTSPISTGLSSIDNVLDHGLQRGKITEIWGPAGTGKTGIALSAASHALKGDGKVFWVDAATPLAGPRLKAAVSSLDTPETRDSAGPDLSGFFHRTCPTLSHLLALILHPPSGFPPANTSLLVLDGINKLIDHDYPRQAAFASNAKSEQQRWQAGRRYAVLGSLVTGLNKLAALHNISVLVTTGCATRSRQQDGLGAALVPGIGGNEWDSGVWNRIALFRDFNGRFAGVQKLQGMALPGVADGGVGRLLAFELNEAGLPRDRKLPAVKEDTATKVPPKVLSPVKPRKRHFDEIADSDGEDADEYGWGGGDESALAGAEAQPEEADLIES